MPGEVNVPVVGKMSKSGVIVTAAAGAVVLGYVIYKKKKTAATAAAAQTPTPTGTTNSYGYNANTGYGYGYGSAGSGYGYQGIQGGNFGEGANSAFGYYAEGNPNTPQTNAAWTQACVAALSNDGYNSETVLAACGVYLTAGELTAAQVQVIQACIANEGYPPTEGAQGFPPQMHTGGTTGGGAAPPPPPPTTGQVKVPACVGLPAGEAHNNIVAAGLRPTEANPQQPNSLCVKITPSAGTMVTSGSNVAIATKGTYVNKNLPKITNG
jgi:hypothetical protein